MSYKSYTFDELKSITEKHTETVIRESSSGKLLFTTYGARLLGLFPKSDATNVLWASQNLENNLATAQWMTGGERLWIAPERDFYYENPRDFDGFHVPASIDPGEYNQTGDLVYENRFPLLHYGMNETLEGSSMRREIKQIDDPYGTGLAYAGVAIKDTLVVTSTKLEVCAWSLSQIYTCGKEAAGTAMYPAKADARILSYFDPIPEARADVQNGYIRFKIDSDAIYKLAIRPEDMVFDNEVKAVYVSPYPNGQEYFCIIKRTNDMPKSQADCVDVPKSDPEGLRGAIQSYNNGPGFSDELEAFGEIELQLSKATVQDDKLVSSANHELLSYAGSKEEILELAAKALKLESAPRLY